MAEIGVVDLGFWSVVGSVAEYGEIRVANPGSFVVQLKRSRMG